MKYENKEAFEQVNMFGTGTPNTAYAKFFIGDSFLNPLTDPKGGLLLRLAEGVGRVPHGQRDMERGG